MVDLAIFAIPSFTRGSTIALLYFLGMTSVWVLVALYLQIGTGKTALQTALVGVPAALTAAVPPAGRVDGSTAGGGSSSSAASGCLVGVFGSIVVALLQAGGHISEWWLVLSLVFVGAAQGSVISPNQTLALADVPLAYEGSPGAVMQTGQRIGTSVGIAVITSATFTVVGATGSWPGALSTGFGLIGVIVLVALVFAVRDRREAPAD